MGKDAIEQMRQKVAQMSPDELKSDHRAVALARAALWPHPPTTS